MRIRTGALLVLVVLSTGVLGAQQPSASEQEVMALRDQRIHAVMANDVKALNTMLADELAWCTAGGNAETKTAYLERVGNGRAKWLTSSITNQIHQPAVPLILMALAVIRMVTVFRIARIKSLSRQHSVSLLMQTV